MRRFYNGGRKNKSYFHSGGFCFLHLAGSYFPSISNGESVFHARFFSLWTFSNDTYSYYNSLGDHIDKGSLGPFGGEVVPVFSNVENGLGVLISVNDQEIQLFP